MHQDPNWQPAAGDLFLDEFTPRFRVDIHDETFRRLFARDLEIMLYSFLSHVWACTARLVSGAPAPQLATYLYPLFPLVPDCAFDTVRQLIQWNDTIRFPFWHEHDDNARTVNWFSNPVTQDYLYHVLINQQSAGWFGVNKDNVYLHATSTSIVSRALEKVSFTMAWAVVEIFDNVLQVCMLSRSFLDLRHCQDVAHFYEKIKTFLQSILDRTNPHIPPQHDEGVRSALLTWLLLLPVDWNLIKRTPPLPEEFDVSVMKRLTPIPTSVIARQDVVPTFPLCRVPIDTMPPYKKVQ
ncbi:hypothetical protein HYDPIDRAFT_33075 [Hydnomerulius pinastri MD-312]|uniref:Unplaced genomic scaffold scaffold_51, whole genome shotgun sequence n=1 Tax=Hydnomerulius pinastri MD-312 TaxID=994086 RepID=A0A0C9VPC9_9AGAM|nr:hypothetical protein HYDPIDRAFT_33075 [Hydnomerulius pinastri MD-312]